MPTTTATDEVRDGARLLARLIEPLTGQVYFAPECHERYEALGFNGSPFTTADGVALPDGPAYFTSRGSALGQVPGELVAAAFGVFNAEAVVPAVTFGWTLTDAADHRRRPPRGRASPSSSGSSARRPTASTAPTSSSRRAVAPLEPWGRALFAGNLALGLPGTPLGDLFRLGDQLREFRGDSHIAAWVAAGHDAAEIGLLTELYWGMPTRTYVRTRAWTDAQLDAAEARLAGGRLHGRRRAHRRRPSPPRGDRARHRRPDGAGHRRPRRRPRRSSTTCSARGPPQVMDAGGYPQSPLRRSPG